MRIVKLSKESKENLLADLLKRDPNNYGQYADTVQAIVDDVKARGDEALFEYTEKFDKVKVTKDTIRVTKEEIDEALKQVDPKLMEVMVKSMKNIRAFHEKQKQLSWFDTTPDGTILGQRVTPLDSAGLYVPGGKAAYPSSVLMNIIPAEVAGVNRIVMVTPPGKDGKVNPVTLAAAHIAGATEVYKVGGAQAIAALAFGTESIPKVNKIAGPGNIYVALAKKAVYGHVSIDSIAGPSEIMVLADESANAKFVAADLLSQAEHDELACAILVTTSMKLAEEVSKLTEEFIAGLSRKEILQKSIDNYGYILVADSMDDAVDVVNEIAPEHLEIQTINPFETMTQVRNAGAIFMGEYSSEPLGDYFAGPNHVLPTNGTAKFFSPLGVDVKVDLSDMHGENRELAEAVNGIGDGIKTAVEKSMKDERLKADLITNVSHDIKTPLTSIINFVNLLKREQIDNERAKGYIQVLDAKSQRLKQLTDDLVEASKITSGNISLQMERLDFKELVKQTCGEFDDKLKEKCLEMIVSLPPEPVYIEADPRRIWRVVENLFSNVCKYALEGTRVYLEIRRVRQEDREIAVFTMKNISAQALNIRAEELTERFIRGDISRSTEGSGLGLSIAQNLTTLQKGTFEIYLDGDLFKVQIGFSCLDVPQPEIEIQMR